MPVKEFCNIQNFKAIYDFVELDFASVENQVSSMVLRAKQARIERKRV